MQVYKLTKVDNLPDILNYNVVNNSKENTDSVEKIGVWDIFSDLKKELSDSKDTLDKFYTTPELRKKFTYIVNTTESLNDLRKQNNVIAKQYNIEYPTNAFLKMYEILTYMFSTKPLQSVDYTTFSVAEAPGNFILAINHFMRTKYRKIKWDWLANSYRSEVDDNYLSDKFGLMRAFPDKWVYGIDNDGDITSTKNIKTFTNVKFDLVTSDVKYVPKDNIYNEEENINLPVITGHTIIAIKYLKKGGSCILKQFTFYECGSVSLLYLLCYCFGAVEIIKPICSKKTNSEVYIYCMDYRDNISAEVLDKLFNYLDTIRYLNVPKINMKIPAIFALNQLNKDWLNNLRNVNTDIQKSQINAIDNLSKVLAKYIYNAKNNSRLSIADDYKLYNNTMVRNWIKSVNIERLDYNDSLIGTKKIAK